MCMYAHVYNVYIYIYINTCLKFVAKHTYIYIYRVKQFCRGYSCFSTLMYLIRPRLQILV